MKFKAPTHVFSSLVFLVLLLPGLTAQAQAQSPKPEKPSAPVLTETDPIKLARLMQNSSKETERVAAFNQLKSLKSGKSALVRLVCQGVKQFASPRYPEKIAYKLRCIKLLQEWAEWPGANAAQALYSASWGAKDEERVAVLSALLAYKSHNKGYMSAFVSAIRSPNQKVRKIALQGFVQHKDQANNYVWSLKDLIKSSDKELARQAFQLLLECGDRGEQVIAQALRSADPGLKLATLEFVDEMEANASKKVVTLLLNTLYDTNIQFRINVLKKLANLGKQHPEAYVGIYRSMSDQEHQVQIAAKEIMDEVDPTGQKASQVLLKFVRSEDRTIRNLAIEAIRDFPCADQAVAQFATDLDSKIVLTRRRATRALYALATHAVVVTDKLAKTLYDTDPEVSRYSAWALVRMGPMTQPILKAAMLSDDLNARRAAASAFAGLDELDPEIMKVFAESVYDMDLQIRYSAIRVLGRAGRGHPIALKTLQKILTEPLPKTAPGLSPNDLKNMRRSAVYSLELMGPDGADAYEALAKIFHSNDRSMQNSATRALASMGAVALKLFRDALTSPDVSTRRNAVLGLGLNKMTDESDEQRILPLLEDKDSNVRRNAVQAVGQVAFDLKRSMPQLKKLLFDPSSSVAVEVARTFAQFGADSQAAVPELAKCLESTKTSSNVKIEAAKALQAIGTGAKAAIPALSKTLHEKQDNLIVPAAKALAILSQKHDSALLALIKNLNHESIALRNVCLEAIQQHAPRAKTAIPALRAWLDKDSISKRLQALQTLAVFGSSAESCLERVANNVNNTSDPVTIAAIWASERINVHAEVVENAYLQLSKNYDNNSDKVNTALIQALGSHKKSNAAIDQFLTHIQQANSKLSPEASQSLQRRLKHAQNNQTNE